MTTPGYISLQALTQHINKVLSGSFSGKEFLVLAVINNLSYYAAKDFYFFELIEKSEDSGQIIARMAASAFGKASAEIRKFQELTGQELKNDLKLLMSIQVDFHTVHGLKLNLIRIDPEYTLGNLERERRMVLSKLVSDNPTHISLVNGEYSSHNKRLPLPLAFKNLAIISSANSAGFQDLMHSLGNNDFGYTFNCDYYFTGVQGEQNSGLMVRKLIEIFQQKKTYDAVVIVRGGGSSSDLFMFDSYDLARAIARFPVPVITGIGHQKNETIADLMAYVCTKTPTKAAEYIISHNHAFEERLLLLQRTISTSSREILSRRTALLYQTGYNFIYATRRLIGQNRSFLHSRSAMLPASTAAIFKRAHGNITALRLSLASGTRIICLKRENELERLSGDIRQGALLMLKNQQATLAFHQKILFILSREQTLKRGFALVRKKGSATDSINGAGTDQVNDLQLDDCIEIELFETRLEAVITGLTVT